jgi:hypothetical protein
MKINSMSSTVLKHTAWPLKMASIGCPKTLVTYYPSILHNIQEKWKSQTKDSSLIRTTVPSKKTKVALSASTVIVTIFWTCVGVMQHFLHRTENSFKEWVSLEQVTPMGSTNGYKKNIFLKFPLLLIQKVYWTHLPPIFLTGCVVETWRMLDLYWAQPQLW